MKLGYPSHGLRITVRLQDTVVAQRVVWAPPVGSLLAGSASLVLVSLLLSLSAGAGLNFLGLLSPFVSQLLLVVLTPAALAMALAALIWPRAQQLGCTGADAVPTADGQALAWVRWSPGAAPVLTVAGGEGSRSMEPGDVWTWRSGEVAVDILAQEREVARRLPLDPLGDIALVVVILTLYVGMAQARLFIGMAPQTATAPPSHSMSPELIARLLQKDLDGEEEGWSEPIDRPDHERKGPGVYMPAGNAGPMTRAGGGSEQGEKSIRGPEPEDEEPVAEPAPVEEAEDQALALTSPPPPTPQELELPAAAEPASLAETALDERAMEASRPQDPIERFIGWGFKDWLDSSPQRDALDPRVERHLMLARARLRLDPDDYGALQAVGHYAYLAENNELSQATFRRLTEKYPEDSAGFNNLALTFKRTQEWTQEEALYRKALQLQPDDPVVLNNLAVNLAHQGRFDEALGLMTLLEEISPDDPYSDLHRAKVYAAMGRKDRAFKYLKRALDGVERLDTLHHIEFRQDLRLEPLLAELRTEARYERLLQKVYGAEAESLLGSGLGRDRG